MMSAYRMMTFCRGFILLTCVRELPSLRAIHIRIVYRVSRNYLWNTRHQNRKRTPLIPHPRHTFIKITSCSLLSHLYSSKLVPAALQFNFRDVFSFRKLLHSQRFPFSEKWRISSHYGARAMYLYQHSKQLSNRTLDNLNRNAIAFFNRYSNVMTFSDIR